MLGVKRSVHLNADCRYRLSMPDAIPIVDAHAPVRSVRIRNACAPPVSDETKELMSRRREALTVYGHRSAIYKDLNRAVRSAIRHDTCNDVRRRIREDGRASMWKAIRSVVGGGKADRALPEATPDQLNEFFVSVLRRTTRGA